MQQLCAKTQYNGGQPGQDIGARVTGRVMADRTYKYF